MSSTLPNGDRLRRLNTVDKATPAKANLTIHEVDTAARIIRLAIARSGIQQKTLGNDKGRVNRLLDGTAKDRLWFHEMIATWPPEVWRELLPLIALEVCRGHFEVERTIAIRERAVGE